MESSDDSDDERTSTEMLEDICDGSKSPPSVNLGEARYKICDCIKQRQTEWKVVLLSTQHIGKGLHKVFKAVVNRILQVLPSLGESGSEVSYFILNPRKLAKATSLSDDIRNPWLKETLKEIKNLINNQNVLVQYPEKG